jgi:CO/xanthine dehydrogenase FAD-binding subunit
MSNFRFFRPKALEELLEYKGKEGARARILDGGSNVLVYIKEGSFKEGTLVDVRSLGAIKGIVSRDGWIEIGAGEVIADIIASPLIQKEAPFLADALKKFANPLVRNMATLAGNIADSSPIGDAIPPLIVLQAEVSVASAAGDRTIPLEEFFTGPGANVLRGEEVILKVRFPVPRQGRGGHVKLGLRKGTSCSVASVAVWLVMDKNRVQDIRIAFGGVAPTPRRAPQTEAAFRGQLLDWRSDDHLRDSITRLAEGAAEELSPITDVRASAEYRRRVSVALLAKAVRGALALEE